MPHPGPATGRHVALAGGAFVALVAGSLFAERHVSPGLMPHGVCYTWMPALLWLHVGSDLLIGLAYLSIPFTLAVLLRRRGRELPFDHVLLLFAAFIVACGLTHFMEVWTVWQPTYWLSGAVKAVTAAVSVPTAGVMVWLLPRALAMPTVEQLQRAQAELQAEVARRRRTEAELRDAQAVLEARVADRTRALAEANALLDTVFERAPLGVGVWDRDGRFVRVNRAFCEIDGVPRDAHDGRPVDAVLPRLRPPLGPVIAEVARSGRAVRGLAVGGRVAGAEGVRHWRASFYPLEVAGARVGVGGLVEETTERHRAERERARLLSQARAAHAEAREANEAKDRFLATVSHELRTPLQAILTWVQVLRHRDAAPADAAGALERIERNVRAQARLIDELLDYSRVVSGKLALAPVPADPAPPIERALDLVRPLAARAGVALHAELSLAGARCLLDADRFQQVVANLAANAVKFTPAGGRVELSADWQPRGLRLQVSDTGVGIEPGLLAGVFEPFRQGRPAHGADGGLGLGLSIARGIVQGLGGRIDASSEGPGRGATFTVWLPPCPAGPGDDANRSDAGRSGEGDERPAARLDDVHVLLVEDDADAGDALALGLGRLGARVTVAGGVAAAVEAAGRDAPDALVSDLRLPDGSGRELPAAISARLGRRIPALAVSAYGRREDRAASLSAGFDAHCVKPVDADSIARSLVSIGVRGAPPG